MKICLQLNMEASYKAKCVKFYLMKEKFWDTLPVDYLDECGSSENIGSDDLNSFLLSNEVGILKEILNDLQKIDPQWNDMQEELLMPILSNTTELNKCCKHQELNSIACVVEDMTERILFNRSSKKLHKVNIIGKLFGASPLIKNVHHRKGSSTLKDLVLFHHIHYWCCRSFMPKLYMYQRRKISLKMQQSLWRHTFPC